VIFGEAAQVSHNLKEGVREGLVEYLTVTYRKKISNTVNILEKNKEAFLHCSSNRLQLFFLKYYYYYDIFVT
jgi:hypothetical protein